MVLCKDCVHWDEDHYCDGEYRPCNKVSNSDRFYIEGGDTRLYTSSGFGCVEGKSKIFKGV